MGPAAGVRRPRTPLLADRLADAEDLAPPRQRGAEQELFREPRDAPEIGRRPLDIGVPHPARCPDLRPAAPIPRQHPREMLLDDDPYGVPAGPRYTARPAHPVQHRLAKLDVFKGEIGEKLDDFMFQVEEFATFHEWDPMETCRQARTHLRGVALAYTRRTPLPPRDWTELKTLLTQRIQPRDLMAAYKAQFRTRKRQRNEDIPTYMDALQKLAKMAWTLLDPIARDEMVADQFLNGLDSHDLRIQVAATGIRRIEDLMRVARSLEAVENLEAGHGRPRRGLNQARFSEGEGPETETDRIVDQLLARLGPELRQSRDLKRRPPTLGPQRVRSVEWETSPAHPKEPSNNKGPEKTGERNRGRSPSTDRSRSRNRDGLPQCYKCKGYGHFMRDWPSGDFYNVGPNGLPVKRREASEEKQKPRETPETDKPLN